LLLLFAEYPVLILWSQIHGLPPLLLALKSLLALGLFRYKILAVWKLLLLSFKTRQSAFTTLFFKATCRIRKFSWNILLRLQANLERSGDIRTSSTAAFLTSPRFLRPNFLYEVKVIIYF
jgi:hypothetical protein